MDSEKKEAPNDPTNFGMGAVKSPLDERDFKMEEIAMGVTPFDWDKGFDIEKELGVKLKPKDQNGSFSCGGQATSKLGAVQEAMATGSFEERSAKFVYAQVFAPGGGSTGRALMDLYVTQGICIEDLCSSYQNGKAPSESFMTRAGDITTAARADAKKTKAKNYVSVSPDIDSIALAVKLYGGVMIGIDGSNNGTWLSEFPKPPKDGEGIWRHWLYVGKAKKIKGKKYLGVLNSWGEDAGDDGWQWISEDYINGDVYDTAIGINQACVWEAWTAVYNPDGVPARYVHNFNKDIAYGQKSEEVRALQQALQVDGSFPAGFSLNAKDYPVAYYGDMTAQAVLKFRLKYGIDSSTDPKGRNAGPKTRTKLNELFNK